MANLRQFMFTKEEGIGESLQSSRSISKASLIYEIPIVDDTVVWSV